MSRDLRDKLAFIAILVVLALIVTDCSSGHKRFCPGVVRQHVYNPPYTTTSTDKHGHGHSTHHPAEYHLIVECEQPHHMANVDVSLFHYGTIDDQQAVVVGERVGRWSKIIYFKWIEKTQRAAGEY